MTITAADVPAIIQALLAKATVPGPPLRDREPEELRTWFMLGVHPDDETDMRRRVDADPWLQATVTVQASVLVDPGSAYLVNQDKLKISNIPEYEFRMPPLPLPMPSWLRDSLYYTPRQTMSSIGPVGL